MNGEPKSDRADAILDVAEDLIRTEGADGWSFDDLASRAGLTVEGLLDDFESEWAVFDAVIRRDDRRFERVVAREPGSSAGEAVIGLLGACVADYDWTYWIELWSFSLRDERARELRVELDERFRRLIEEMVCDGVESGEFSVPDARIAAVTIATLIDSMAVQATLGDSTVRPNYMLDACATVTGSLLGATLPLPPLGGNGHA